MMWLVGDMLGKAIAPFWPYVLGLMALLGVGWRVVAGIKSNERQKAKLDAAEEYQRTIKEMGNVEVSDDHDVVQLWLKDRGKR